MTADDREDVRHVPARFRAAPFFPLLAGLVVIFVFSFGVYLFKSQQREARHRVIENLTAVSSLKADQIVAWRNDRLRNADDMVSSRFIIAAIDRWLKHPHPVDHDALLARFASLAARFGYSDVLVIDTEGRVRLSLSGRTDAARFDTDAVRLAMLSDKAMLTELHLDAETGQAHLDAVAPLTATGGWKIGALVMQTPADAVLYPMIQRWPTASASAETLLVRREGDAVLYLNALRHRDNAAMKLRIPLSRDDLPASRAIRGQVGAFDGVDHRGAAVLSVLSRIPDSDWFMVAKIDRDDAFAEWRGRAILVFGMMAFLGAALLAGLFVVRQRLLHLRSRQQAEGELLSQGRLTGAVLDSIGHAVVVLDARGVILRVNAAWRAFAAGNGGDAATTEGVGCDYLDVCLEPGAGVAGAGKGIRAVLAGETPSFAFEYPCHSPTEERWFLMLVTALAGRQGGCVISHVDISMRKTAERMLLRDAERQTALRRVFEITDSPAPMTEVLERCLDLLLSTNWLGLSRLGGIHVKATNGRRALSVARNLPAAVLDECARCRLDLRPGEAPGLLAPCRSGCAPGEARGQTGIVLDDTDGSRHHCLALTADQETFGVLLVTHDREGTDGDDRSNFLDAVAAILGRYVQRRNAEESLRKFSLVVEQSSNAILIASETSEIEYVNAAFTRITGYRAEEVQGMNPRLLQSGKSDLAVYADIWARLLRGDSWSGELVNRRKDGSDYICQQVISPIRGKDGRVSHYASIGEDVTEHKAVIVELERHREHLEELVEERTREIDAANKALARQEQFVRMVADNISSIVMYWDRDLRCRFANAGFQAWFGLSPDEVVGRHYREAAGDELYETNKERIRAALAGERQQFFRMLRHADGSMRFLRTTYVPDIVDGEVRGFVSAVADVTDLKEAEMALAERTADLERAQAIAHVGSWKLDIANDVLAWSSETYRIFGVRPGTPLNMAVFLDCVHPDDRLRVTAAWQAALAGAPYDIEHRVRAGETVKWVREQAEVIFDADGSAVSGVGAVQDITLAKAAKEATQQALDVARRLSAAKGEFLANMSHEIRTPLNAVLGLAQLGVQDSAGRKTEDTFRRILESGRHLLGVVNDVLDFSKYEAGKLSVECMPFRLGEVIDRAIALTIDAARGKGLRFDLDEAADLPLRAQGDAMRLTQVLVNLLSNAVKFTDQGTVGLSVSVANEPLGNCAASLVFRVRDTGIGMTEAQRTRLFQAFEQADTSITRRYGGTGLGLALSRGLVESMGGRLDAVSRPGRGSEFELRLPLCREAAAGPDSSSVSEVRGTCIRIAGLPPDESERLAAALTHAGASVELLAAEAALSRPLPDRLVLSAQALRQCVFPLPEGVLVFVVGDAEMRAGIAELPPGNLHPIERPLRARHLCVAAAQGEARAAKLFGADKASGARLVGLRILAAEDNALNRLVLADILAREGGRVVFAENGKQLIDLLKHERADAFDLVLMDVQMPEMDGIEATRRLHALAPDLPVIGLTADARPEERARCLAVGMVAHVTKPIDIGILVGTILERVGERCVAPSTAVTANAASARLPETGGKALSQRDMMPDAAVAPIDLPALLAQFNGRRAFVAKLLRVVLDTHADTSQSLRQAAGNRDMRSLAFVAHSLKGACGNVKAVPMQELAARLEEATRNIGDGDPAAVTAEAMALADALDAFAGALKDCIDRLNPETTETPFAEPATGGAS